MARPDRVRLGARNLAQSAAEGQRRRRLCYHSRPLTARLRRPQFRVSYTAMANMALRAARSAGRIIARAVDRTTSNVEEKQKNDLVSEIDRAAEAAIIEELHKTYPGHSIIGEESGKAIDGDEDYTWIIDPLDGTTNFLHGIPHFAVSIGCVHRGRIEHAVVLDPLRDESFVASRGHGAQLNEKRIRVTRRDRLDSAVVGTGIPFRQNDAHLDAYMRQLTVARQARGSTCGLGRARPRLRRSGTPRCVLGDRPKPWDMAAGALLVTEAGGLVSDFEGGTFMDAASSAAIRSASRHCCRRSPRHAGHAATEEGLRIRRSANSDNALDQRVLIGAFRLRQDQVLTIDLERDQHVRRHVDRRVGPHDHTHHQRLRKPRSSRRRTAAAR